MHKRTGFFSDMMCQLGLRMKLFLRDKATILVFLISALCFLFCMADMNQSAEENTSIPIGVVNLDEGERGAALVWALQEREELRVTKGTLQELMAPLMEGMLRCVVVLKEDYSEELDDGEYEELMTLYYAESDALALVVGDIIVAELMYEVCLERGYQAYERLPEPERKKRTEKEYKEYVASLIDGEDFDFAFEFRYESGYGEKEEKPLANSMFYRQAVAAVAAMLMTLLQLTTMAQLQLERQQGIRTRRRLTCMSKGADCAGNILAAGLLSMLLALLFGISVGVGMQSAGKIFSVFLLSLLFSVGMAVVYYILSRCARSVLQYQVIGAVWLLLSGLSGFCYMAEGILLDRLPELMKYIPNVWYLKQFTRLIY